MSEQFEHGGKLDPETIIQLIDENQKAIQECGKDFQQARATFLEISKDLFGTAKKVKFDKKYQYTLEYLGGLFKYLEDIYGNHEFFTRSFLMQQHNHLVTMMYVTLTFRALEGLAKKVPEAAEEIAQIKEILKKYDPIMAEVDEQIKIAKAKKKQAEELNKADAERLKKLGATYQ